MKKIAFIGVVFLGVLAFSASAETSIRAGKPATAARLNIGQNDGDAIAQLALGLEYAVIPHLSVGAGYVYVDGIDPLQEHGLDLSLKGYLFERELDLYADLGSQFYMKDGIDTVLTVKIGLEWQSPFGLFCAGEGGVELEGSNWGYLYGLRIGYRF